MCRVLVCLLVFSLCSGIHAQTSNPETTTPDAKASPIVSFDFAFPGATPSHYSMEVESAGHVSYRSDDGAQARQELSQTELYAKEFTISEATCARIFQLARQANYFKGNFNYSKGRIANLGTKTLIYAERQTGSDGKPAGVHYQTVYNYSENGAIQQLTFIFQGLSNTIELGRRLKFHQRFDKLGLDSELKTAENMTHSGQLIELQVIAPVLREAAEDTSVLNIARERARRLLEQAVSGVPTPSLNRH